MGCVEMPAEVVVCLLLGVPHVVIDLEYNSHNTITGRHSHCLFYCPPGLVKGSANQNQSFACVDERAGRKPLRVNQSSRSKLK